MVLVLVAAAQAAAQTQPRTTPEQVAKELGYDLAEPLSLEQCIAIALRVHPDVEIAAAELERATASLRQARASLWPLFRASTDYRVTQQPQRTVVIGGAVIPVGGGRNTSRNSQVEATYSLYESTRSHTIRQAGAYRDAASASFEATQRELAYRVTQAYYDRLAAERLVAAKEAAVASAQAHVEQVQARIEAGDAPPVEIHALRAQLHAAQLDLSAARNQAAIARATLRMALGGPNTEIRIAEVWEEPSALPDLLDVVAAAATRPDIRQQEALVRAARLGVKLARLQQRPQLNIVGGGEYGRHDGQTGPSWSVFGTVTQTIFDGGATKAAVQRAEAELRSAEAQLERLRQTARLEIESAWLRLRQSAEAIAAAEAAQTEAHAALAAAETRYSANVGLALEITDAQAKAAEADANVVRAYYEYNVSLAELERATAARSVP